MVTSTSIHSEVRIAESASLSIIVSVTNIVWTSVARDCDIRECKPMPLAWHILATCPTHTNFRPRNHPDNTCRRGIQHGSNTREVRWIIIDFATIRIEGEISSVPVQLFFSITIHGLAKSPDGQPIPYVLKRGTSFPPQLFIYEAHFKWPFDMSQRN
ncbi:hypothetical protein K474DRAFT_164534 [Panus rudis PR-1116 ss-1]|nr:hypothetical protein K474DRAFT_164534 [Panus rudis PR-1116 ss-1]